MDFFSAVKNCLRQYVTFTGRATRAEFWWFFLFQLLIFFGATIIDNQIYKLQDSYYYDDDGRFLHGMAFQLTLLALVLPALAVGARRLRDIGQTGWWQLLMFTGIGYFVLIYFWTRPSEK